jgi:hypothetical protein
VAGRAGERHIELTVRRVDGSLHGSAHDHAGQTHTFIGWLGLLGVLESLLADPETASTTEET